MGYIKEKVLEVVYAVLPVTLVVVLMQLTFVQLPMEEFLNFLIGALFVGIGLVLFLIGVHIGLLPVGEMIGEMLPRTGKVWLISVVGLTLGFVVTVAEPDVRVLSNQVDQVSGGGISATLLTLAVAAGVGVFVLLAMLKTVYKVPIHYLLIGGYTFVFILSMFTPNNFIPISFDAGGVTTGPMTVPFILALGVGVASVLRGENTPGDGFGIVALASIGPIIAVMLLGVIYG